MSIKEKNQSSVSSISKTLTEVYIKSLKHEENALKRLDESLGSNSMKSFLLNEAEDSPALDKSDVEELKAAGEAMKKTLGDLSTALKAAGGKFSGTSGAVEALGGEIPDPGSLANMILDPKPGEISSAVEAINEGISNAGSAAASIIEAVKLFSEELSNAVGDLPEEMKQKTLEELGEMAAKGELKDENEKEIKLDAKRLASGAEKAVQVPAWYEQAFKGGMDAGKEEAGGFFSKVGAFFKGLFGKKQAGIDPKIFSKEIMTCTIEELGKVAEGTAAVQEAMVEAVETGAEATTASQAGAVAAEQPGAGQDFKGLTDADILAQISDLLKKSSPEFAKKLADAGPEAAEAALSDEVDALQSGELEDLEAAAEEAAEEGIGKSWEEISTAAAEAAEDKASAEKVLAKVGADQKFKDALKDKITFEEGNRRSRRGLASLLFETVSFEEFQAVSGADELGDDVDKEAVLVQIAKGINDELEEEAITDIPELEERDEEEPPPADEEEAEEEQDDAQEELESAVKDAAGDTESPGAAIMTALDDWVAGLSATSQKSMETKDRIGGLKSNIQSALDSASETLSKAIGKAITTWRGEHEDTLIKSKRFAKKNFESLSQLIPQLAAELLKRTDESSRKITQSDVNRVVHKFLDKKFMRRETANITRLNELAGLPNEWQDNLLLEISDEDKEKIDPVLDPADAFAPEFESDDEAAEAKLKEPAAAMGGSLEADELALGLKYAEEGDEEELYDVLDDADVDPDKVVDQLKQIPDMFGEEEEEEEVQQSAEELADAYFEKAKEDAEAAMKALQDPAQKLGIEPPKLADALKDPEKFMAAADLEEAEPLKIADALVAAEDDLSGEGEPDKEDAAAAEEVSAELKSAVQDAASAESNPAAAVMAALDGWVDGLSSTSQKSLQTKDRIGGLKTGIQAAVDSAADELSKSIDQAIQAWRGDHEETLIKSRRFAKKNFDSLSKMIPSMAQQLLKKTNENSLRLTHGMVKKYVNTILNRHFQPNSIISENNLRVAKKKTTELQSLRWVKTLGIEEEGSEIISPLQTIVESHAGEDTFDEELLVRNKWARMAGLGD